MPPGCDTCARMCAFSNYLYICSARKTWLANGSTATLDAYKSMEVISYFPKHTNTLNTPTNAHIHQCPGSGMAPFNLHTRNRVKIKRIMCNLVSGRVAGAWRWCFLRAPARARSKRLHIQTRRRRGRRHQSASSASFLHAARLNHAADGMDMCFFFGERSLRKMIEIDAEL